MMVRFETLLAALAVSAPTLWGAFVSGNTSVDTALLRFLLAVPVCAVGFMLLRKVFTAYSGPTVAVVAAEQALDDTREVLARRREDAARADAAGVPSQP
jgi:hypothetical protein